MNPQNIDSGYGEIPFPRYIDKPRLIGIFEIDEFMVSFGLLAIIIITSLAFPSLGSTTSIFVGFALSAVITMLYKKFKKNKADGFAFQKLYRLGIISPMDNKRLYIKYPYLSKIGRVVPFGFTVELLN